MGMMAEDDDVVGGEEEEEEQQQSSVHYWPVLDFSTPPSRRYHFSKQLVAHSPSNNFFKGVKWWVSNSCTRAHRLIEFLTYLFLHVV
jgi:hypothetical protein